MELAGAEVVEQDMKREDALESSKGRVGGEEVGHGGVVHREDGDGGTGVDLGGKVGQGEVVVEGREARVPREESCDIVGTGRASHRSQDEEEEEEWGELDDEAAAPGELHVESRGKKWTYSLSLCGWWGGFLDFPVMGRS